MRYTIHKCCKLEATDSKIQAKLRKQSLQSYRIIDLERPDVCKDETEAVETFKDAFKHHIGRKPTNTQIDIFKKFENVFVEDGDITYIFYMFISE